MHKLLCHAPCLLLAPLRYALSLLLTSLRRAIGLLGAPLRGALSLGSVQLRHVHGLKARLVASGVVAKCNLGVLNDLVDLNHGTVLLKA